MWQFVIYDNNYKDFCGNALICEYSNLYYDHDRCVDAAIKEANSMNGGEDNDDRYQYEINFVYIVDEKEDNKIQVKYWFLQLAGNHKNKFKDLAHATEPIKKSDYVCVWCDTLLMEKVDDAELCEKLYRTFNTNHPEHFGGHSMSLSDLILISDGKSKENRLYYCDEFGFTKVQFAEEN